MEISSSAWKRRITRRRTRRRFAARVSDQHVSPTALSLALPYPELVEFQVVSDITDTLAIARGVSVRQRARLTRMYGQGRWRKMKGRATVELKTTGRWRPVELHWFEAHGIGPREMKIKRFLD